MKRTLLLLFFFQATCLLASGTDTDTSTYTPTSTPSITDTSTPTVSDTSTPSQSATISDTSTPTPSQSATPSDTSTPTQSATISDTSTPTPTLTESSTQTPFETPTQTPSFTPWAISGQGTGYASAALISWSAATLGYPVGEYEIFEQDSPGGSFALTQTVDSGTLASTIAIPCGTNVNVELVAVDDAGNSSPKSLTATTSSPCAPDFSALSIFSSLTVPAGQISLLAVTPAAEAEPLNIFYGFAGMPGAANPITTTVGAALGVTVVSLAANRQSYWIRGYAVNPSGVTVAAASDIAVMPPPQISAVAPYFNSVYLGWESVTLTASVPEITGYVVYYDVVTPTVSSPSVVMSTTQTDSTGLVGETVTGLSTNSIYYFEAAALGGTGNGFLGSPSALVTARTGYPSPPITLVQQIQGGPLSISWSAVNLTGDTLTAYGLYASPDLTFSSVTLLASLSTSTKVTVTAAAAPGVNYYFVVVSGTSGASTLTPSAGAYLAIASLSPPQAQAVTSDGRVLLNWNTVSGATEYGLLSSTSSAFPVSDWAEVNLSGTSYIDFNAQSGQPNYYTVLARQRFAPGSSFVESAVSPFNVSATPMILPGEPGRNFSTTTFVDNYYLTGTAFPSAVTGIANIKLSWAAALSGSVAVSLYEVYRGDTFNDMSLLLTKSAAAPDDTSTSETFSCVDWGRDASQTYSYGVTAVDVSGEAGPQLQGSVGPYAYITGPVSLTLLSVSGRQVALGWNTPTAASAAASSYDVYRSLTPSSLGTFLGTTYLNIAVDATVPTNDSFFYYSIFTRDTNNILGPVPSQIMVTDPATVGQSLVPNPVAGVSAVSVSGPAESMLLQWSPNPDADNVTEYAVYRSYHSGAYGLVAIVPGVSYLDATNLPYDGTLLGYNVQALRGSAAGVSGSATVALLPPTPLDLSISTQADSNADLTPGLQLLWADMGVAGNDITSYNLYRSATAFASPSQTNYLATVTNTSYRDTSGWVAGTRYYYGITSEDNSQESPLSSNIFIYPRALPDAPTGANAIALTAGGQVLVSWNSLTNTSKIWIYRNGVSLTSSVAGLATSFVDTAAEAGTPFSYAVAGANFMGQSSQDAVALPVTPVPGPVQSFSILENVSPFASTTLSWIDPAAPADADTYVVERSTNAAFIPATQVTLTSTSFVDNAAVTGTANYYSVTSYKGGVTGSAGVSVTNSTEVYGLPRYPRGLTLTGLPNEEAALSWEPAGGSQGITGYWVDYAIYSATSAALNISNSVQLAPSATSYLIGTTLTGAPVFITADLIAQNMIGVSQSAMLSVTSNAELGVLPPLSFTAAVGFVEAQSNQTFVRLSWIPPLDPTISGNPAYSYVIYESTAGFRGGFGNLHGGPASPFYNQTVIQDFSSGVTTVAVAAVSGTSYSFALTTLNSSLGYSTGESSAVISQPFKVVPYSYPAYVSITALGVGINRADFSWAPPAYLGSAPALASLPYLVYRFTGSAPLAASAATADLGFPMQLSSTSFSDTHVVDGSSYYYYIAVVDSLGNTQTPPEAVSAAAFVPQGVPDPPYDLLLVPGYNLVTISWLVNAPTTPMTFNIYRRVTAPVTWTAGVTDSTEYEGPLSALKGVGPASIEFSSSVTQVVQTVEDTTVLNKVTYCYTISAVTAAGEGQRSFENCVTPFQQVAPPANSTLTLEVVNKKQIELSWYSAVSPSSDNGWPVGLYQVLRSNNGGLNWTELTAITPSAVALTQTVYSYIDTTTQFGQNYVYKVIPVDTEGNLGQSYQLATINIPGPFNNILVYRNSFDPAVGDTCPVQYSLISNGHAWVRIYNLQGQFIKTLFDETVSNASASNPYLSNKVLWDGKNENGVMVASGVYLIHLDAPGVQYDARIALIK